MIRKLALSGLKGRPKQTRVLLVALVLSFLFVTTSILLLHTSQLNREEQKRKTFGDWTNVYVQEEAPKRELLEEENVVIAENRILGTDHDFGLIGTADQAFYAMAHLHVLEGRLPEAKDEIALLETQLSQFKVMPKVGEKYNILVKVAQSVDRYQADSVPPGQEEILASLYKAVYAHWDEIARKVEQLQAKRYPVPEAVIRRSMQERGLSREQAVRLYRAQLSAMEDLYREIFSKKPASESEAIDYLKRQEKRLTERRIAQILNSREELAWFSRGSTELEAVKQQVSEASSVAQRLEGELYADRRMQNRVEVEGANGTSMRTTVGERKRRLDLRTLRFASYLGGLLEDDMLPEAKEYLWVGEVEAFMYREMTLTGIVSNYTHTWDGPSRTYPTAFVSEQTGQAFYEECLWLSSEPYNQSYQPKYNYFIKSSLSPYAYEQAHAGESRLFSNELGYPKGKGLSEDVLSKILLGLIALFTCFALYQISLVQLKKRLRKLALLRALGATFGQLKALLRWEAFYVLSIALPLGALSGFVVSLLVLRFNQGATGEVLTLRVDGVMLTIGLMVTTLFALIGLFLPLRQVQRVPLRGSIQVEDHKKMKKTRALIGEVQNRMQSLASINKRHHRFIRRQRRINTALYAFILLILLGSMLLIHRAFDDYRQQVTRMGMPDFELELPFQRSQKVNDDIVSALRAVPGVERVSLMSEGEKSFLYFPGIEHSLLLKHFLGMIPEALHLEYFGTDNDFIYQPPYGGDQTTSRSEEEMTEWVRDITKKSPLVDIYGIPSDSPAMAGLKEMLPVSFDWTAFQRGDTVILLQPAYTLRRAEPTVVSDPEDVERFSREERLRGLLELTEDGLVSYDRRLSAYLSTDPLYSEVASIEVITETGHLSGSENQADHSVYLHTLQVGAVLHALPEGGLWPLSKTTQGPVILASPYLVGELYPSRMHTPRELDLREYIAFFSPTAYGRTWIHIYQENITEETTMQIRKIAGADNFMLQSPYIQKQELYNKGFRTSLIVGLLALALLLIALQILSSAFKGRLEVERERIGILQSLGVTGREYRRDYLRDALREVAKAILITHLVLALSVSLYVLLRGMYLPFVQEMKRLFDAYPWHLHLGITLFYALGAVLVAYLPLGSILKKKPVENIRSLQ